MLKTTRESLSVLFTPASSGYIHKIQELIVNHGRGKVLIPTDEQLLCWARNNCSWVGISGEQVVGHVAIDRRRLGCRMVGEVRTCVSVNGFGRELLTRAEESFEGIVNGNPLFAVVRLDNLPGLRFFGNNGYVEADNRGINDWRELFGGERDLSDRIVLQKKALK